MSLPHARRLRYGAGAHGVTRPTILEVKNFRAPTYETASSVLVEALSPLWGEVLDLISQGIASLSPGL